MTFRTLSLFSLFFAIVTTVSVPKSIPEESSACSPMGWFPTTFGLKDHAVFHFNGYTYIASNYIPGEKKFAYARSQDFCNWEELAPILTNRVDNAPDEASVWAPHVVVKDGTYFMFYTGVNDYVSQSIMLATSTNPANPASWQEHGVVFIPTHPNAVWSANSWSDNRDPTVAEFDGNYYLFYTGRDHTGGIVGVAKSASLYGPWTDFGATLGPLLKRTMESSYFFSAWGSNYLIYHSTWLGKSSGGVVQVADSPLGPWTQTAPIAPGWAHEFWQDLNGDWYTSYLTNLTITIRKLNWDTSQTPPQPYIDGPLTKTFLPLTKTNP